MTMFEPKREDGRPSWKVIFDHVHNEIVAETLHVGDVIPHQKLRDLLTPEELKHYYAIVGRAGLKLRDEHMRSLESVRGAGYRLIAGLAQIEQGQGHHGRAKRSLKRGYMVMETSDRGLMAVSERNYADRKQMVLGTIIGVLKMHDDKIIRMGEEMESLKRETYTRHDATEEEIQAIKTRLAELEKRKRGEGP